METDAKRKVCVKEMKYRPQWSEQTITISLFKLEWFVSNSKKCATKSIRECENKIESNKV